MTHDCPLCGTATDKQVASTPYHECPTCFLWFQDPMPPKVYQAPNEYDLEAMPARDREINVELARGLFANVIGGKAGRTLDIGCKHPVMAAELARLGCEAHAIDGVMPSLEGSITCAAVDFEMVTADDFLSERGKFRLITMIHVFEHMYDPLAALRKLRALVEDDGRVFLRLPDHRVKGFERDLTDHHYTIHPYFHCPTSIMEALAQVRDCFVIERTYDFPGAGQRDIVLRPIKRAPTLAVAMIAKNEERDIGRAISSARPIADHFRLVDTGSTDRTIQAAAETWGDGDTFFSRTYTDASERDESGEWKLWNFAEARNHSLKDAEATDADWIMWLDADDEVLTPNAIRRAMYWPQWDVFSMWIDGGHKWIQHRMWKAAHHVRFKGRCHEYPVLDGLATATIDEALIRHHAEPTPGVENSNPRNLRILLREWGEDPTARTAFYIANTYRDAGKHDEAAQWYASRIAFGEGFRDEYLFSILYRARSLRELGRHDAADIESQRGIALAPHWAEFRMELAYGRYRRGRYTEAIAEALKLSPYADIPSTPLWRELSMYRDQPARLISWCHEHLGDLALSLEWADVAAKHIGGPDADWEHRARRLRAQIAAKDAPSPAIVKRLRRQVALHRPGAIGDILMTLNLVPAFKEANPDTDVHYFCDPRLGAPDALGGIMAAAGVDLVMDCSALSAWRKNYDSVVDLIGYPLADGYPEKPMRRHLLEYFALEMGLSDPLVGPLSIGSPLPSLTLAQPHGNVDLGQPYATMQIKAGWSSYKEWSAANWLDVVKRVPFPVVMIDEQSGNTLAQSIAIFANARMHLGIDSFTNHLTNYFWETPTSARKVRGVILWGSTQYDASGYPSNVNISKGLACQPCFRENPAISRMPRDVCVNPPGIVTMGMPGMGFVNAERFYGDGLHECMAQITVDEVVEAATKLWEETA